MTRLLFVGQAPSRETEGLPPFVGKCGKFLAELMGTTQEQMLLDHDFVNILNFWPGRGINGDLFPLPAARDAAKKLLDGFVGRRVVLLGNNVARAFGVTKFQYFQVYEFRHPSDPRVVICEASTVIPHPSGLVRNWNVRSNREIASKLLRTLAS